AWQVSDPDLLQLSLGAAVTARAATRPDAADLGAELVDHPRRDELPRSCRLRGHPPLGGGPATPTGALARFALQPFPRPVLALQALPPQPLRVGPAGSGARSSEQRTARVGRRSRPQRGR